MENRSNNTIVNNRTIAVLLATYNGESYLEEQLKSLLDQTYKDFCCFIHDDGSSDNTLLIIDKYCSNYADKFVLLEGEPKGGAKNNFMFLLNSVVSEYTMFCDQDDIWNPEKIEVTYHEMMKQEENGKPTCVYTDVWIVDSDLKVIDDSFYSFTHINPNNTNLKELLLRNVAIGLTMMINRELRDRALEIIDLCNIYMHDWWIMLVCALEGRALFIKKRLAKYRQHNNNVLGAKRGGLGRKINKLFNLKSTVITKRTNVKLVRMTAGELARLSYGKNRDREFLTELAKIEEFGKVHRIIFYIKNDLIYDDASIIWQLLWI